MHYNGHRSPLPPLLPNRTLSNGPPTYPYLSLPIPILPHKKFTT
nr:MAG TPA: hypothetical protein [Caudoviricetes sp.]